jgi:uncharacterized membrane protein
MNRSELLGHITLFESLTSDELDILGANLAERQLAPGEIVFKQGDQGGEMYLVESGSVDISVGAGSASVTVASLFAGQYFGELSLFDGMARSATATATKPTTLLKLTREDLVRFIDAYPEGAIRILAEMSNRMRKTNELMSSQVSRNVMLEHDEHLSLSDRIADKVASFGGSWYFISAFIALIVLWMVANIFMPYDRPGFMVLNLVLAVIAAGQAPIIMMSQNRQDTKSKLLAENDYKVNLKNELGISNIAKGQAEILQRLSILEKQMATTTANRGRMTSGRATDTLDPGESGRINVIINGK